MKSPILAAAMVSLAANAVAIAQDAPSWTLNGDWTCVAGCFPTSPPRTIIQDGASITFFIPNYTPPAGQSNPATAIWEKSDRVFVPGWNDTATIQRCDCPGGARVIIWDSRVHCSTPRSRRWRVNALWPTGG
jgi:hypothetical protein